MANEHFLYPTNMVGLFPESTVEKWKTTGKVMTFNKGDYICTPGQLMNTVYYIVEGHARIFHLHLEGKECVLGVLSEGDFIDLLQLFADKESQLFAKALTEVKVIALSKSEVKKEIQQNEALSTAFLTYFSDRLHDTIEILEQVAYGKVEERLLFLFDKLANKSESAHGWYPLPAYITHKDIAGMIASTRETVTFLINKLTQTGRVKQENQRIWINGAE